MLKSNRKIVELLAPAKDYSHGCDAILCGADALYVGAPEFGARAAAGVPLEEIEQLCAFAHRYGARVYVAMNTLLFEEEIPQAQAMVHELWRVGADALIVQDLAFLRMELPPIELHASTQMCNTSPERVKFLQAAGFTRIILERALNLEEMQQIAQTLRQASKQTNTPPAELEAFIHGAICVSHSGHCYMSRTTSPRSGNRGACSQSCRLRYNLLDENQRPILKDKHLLSVQDMNATPHLEEMIDAGITSFKIEGRLKEMNYVRNVVSWYRRQLDTIIATRDDLERASVGLSSTEFEPNPIKSFARGATPYYIKELREDIASFDTPKSLGEYIGKVLGVRRDHIELEGAEGLATGDGICFVSEQGALVGTSVNRVEGRQIYPNRMDDLTRGVEVYRNYDRLFVSAVERSRLRRAIPVLGSVEVSAEQIKVTLREGTNSATVQRTGTFDPAKQPEKAEQTLRDQLAKLGDTIYSLSALDVVWDQARFVPISLLNDVRREAAEALDSTRMAAYTRRERRPEITSEPFPMSHVTGTENIVNSLSERFLRDHGVVEIEPGYDLSSELTDCTVMQMRYCLRREMGECLKENSTYTGQLYIENGLHIYALEFDCARCLMRVVYRGKRERITRRTAEF